jgi:hypothetical protein
MEDIEPRNSVLPQQTDNGDLRDLNIPGRFGVERHSGDWLSSDAGLQACPHARHCPAILEES